MIAIGGFLLWKNEIDAKKFRRWGWNACPEAQSREGDPDDDAMKNNWRHENPMRPIYFVGLETRPTIYKFHNNRVGHVWLRQQPT